MNIILSIHPNWAELIYEGKKTIEWRKVAPNRLLPMWLEHKPLKVYLYETAPVKKVTGYFVCDRVVRLNLSWPPPFDGAKIHPVAENVINEGCVPLDELRKYAGKKTVVNGLKVLNCTRFFKGSKTLEDFGLKRAPQSWQYTEVEV